MPDLSTGSPLKERVDRGIILLGATDFCRCGNREQQLFQGNGDVMSDISSTSAPANLRTLVDTFKKFDFDSVSPAGLEKFRSPAILFSRQHWEGIRGLFSIPDTIVLAQALTVLEREFGWTGGSGAGAIWVVKDLLERQPNLGAVLADWIVPRTRNGYLRLACDRRPAVRLWVGDLSSQRCGN